MFRAFRRFFYVFLWALSLLGPVGFMPAIAQEQFTSCDLVENATRHELSSLWRAFQDFSRNESVTGPSSALTRLLSKELSQETGINDFVESVAQCIARAGSGILTDDELTDCFFKKSQLSVTLRTVLGRLTRMVDCQEVLKGGDRPKPPLGVLEKALAAVRSEIESIGENLDEDLYKAALAGRSRRHNEDMQHEIQEMEDEAMQIVTCPLLEMVSKQIVTERILQIQSGKIPNQGLSLQQWRERLESRALRIAISKGCRGPTS